MLQFGHGYDTSILGWRRSAYGWLQFGHGYDTVEMWNLR